MVCFLLLVYCGLADWCFGFGLGFFAQPVWITATNEMVVGLDDGKGGHAELEEA